MVGTVSNQGASGSLFCVTAENAFDIGITSEHVNEGTVTQEAPPFVMLITVYSKPCEMEVVSCSTANNVLQS